MIAIVWLGYITSVHLAQCLSCLLSGKATLLRSYGVFTIVRCYAYHHGILTASQDMGKQLAITTAAVTTLS